MFLFVRFSFTTISWLVMIGKRITRKTLEPKFATLSATYLLVPSTMETTTIRVATERITPSRVRKERSLWVRSVSKAISIGSLSDTPLRVVFGIDIVYLSIQRSEIYSAIRGFYCQFITSPDRRRKLSQIVLFSRSVTGFSLGKTAFFGTACCSLPFGRKPAAFV